MASENGVISARRLQSESVQISHPQYWKSYPFSPLRTEDPVTGSLHSRLGVTRYGMSSPCCVLLSYKRRLQKTCAMGCRHSISNVIDGSGSARHPQREPGGQKVFALSSRWDRVTTRPIAARVLEPAYKTKVTQHGDTSA